MSVVLIIPRYFILILCWHFLNLPFQAKLFSFIPFCCCLCFLQSLMFCHFILQLELFHILSSFVVIQLFYVIFQFFIQSYFPSCFAYLLICVLSFANFAIAIMKWFCSAISVSNLLSLFLFLMFEFSQQFCVMSFTGDQVTKSPQ